MARIAERLPLRHARTLVAALHALVAVHAMAAPSPPAAPAYTLSAPFKELRRDGVPAWDGEHRFGDVFCLRVPDPAEGTALAETFFNHHTLYFSRVDYPSRRINLYVVTSRLPAQLDPSGEHAEQQARAQQYVQQLPTHAHVGEMRTALGPSVTLRLRNVLEGGGSAPFPFERRFGGEADSPLFSLSTHRLFSNNGSRIELAALQGFSPPLRPEQETAAAEALEAFVDRAAASLGECTAALAARAP